MKGQQARAGSGPRPGFEGGQTPLIRRLPVRRGFRNPFRVEFTPVNLRDLARLPASAEVTPDSLKAAGIIHSAEGIIKLLGTGDIQDARTVRVHRVSATARTKIEAAGGSVQETMMRKPPKERKVREASKAPVDDAASAEAAEEPDDSSSPSPESADTD
jgi:large subunit ribosomal protein L15